jgi:hypothetical protein
MNLLHDIHKRSHEDMPAGEGGAPLIQYRWEFEQLYKEVELHAKAMTEETTTYNILEIGSERGGSLYYWLKLVGMYGGKVVSVDLPNGLYDVDYNVWENWFNHDNTSFGRIQGSSHSPLVKESIEDSLHGELFDFVFIDGDHTYAGIKQDFLLALELTNGYPSEKTRSIIALHDICPHAKAGGSEVHRLWKEIVEAGYKTRVLMSKPNQDERGIGCVYL